MDAISLIGRLVLALAVVLGAMWLFARVAHKRGRTSRKGQVLTVLARQSVGRNSSVAIVKVLDRAMVVGITDGQINLLGDTDLAAVELAVAPAQRGPVATEEPDAAGIAAGVAIARPARSRATRHRSPVAAGLQGSALSPATWKQSVEAIRERTVRRV